MPEVSLPPHAPKPPEQGGALSPASRAGSSTSFAAVAQALLAHRWFVLSVIGGLLALCLVYCFIAPNQYEAKARVALRVAPESSLNLEAQSGSYGSSSLELAEIETIANVFRSDKLAWRILLDQKLYANPAFNGQFQHHFPNFNPNSPDPAAEEYLLKRFQSRLHVSTVPRTLLVEIRFRTKDAALSADVINALIRGFEQEASSVRLKETSAEITWLQSQLATLKTQAAQQEQRMSAFQRQHGVLIAPESHAGEQSAQMPELVEVNDLSHELVAASSERILCEARYRAAMQDDPELILDSDARIQSDNGNISAALFKQIHSHKSDLEQELAQLTLEHGPNYERVVEVRQQLADLDKQLQAQRAKLRETLRSAFETSTQREQMLRASLEERTTAGQKATDAATQYEAMRQEAFATRDLYIRTQAQLQQAALAAGVHEPEIWIVDPAHTPAKPAAPDLPLYMAITLFIAIWLALGGALLMESLHPKLPRIAATMLLFAVAFAANSQAPTPNTSGLPSGVSSILRTPDTKSVPNPKEAPPIWSGTNSGTNNTQPQSGSLAEAQVPAPLAPGDLLEVSEFHTPEFRSTVRISQAGTVILPMVGEIRLIGLDEAAAAQVISSALVEKGMLLHPQVFVLVTQFAGQDISILGDVVRPGVYPYTPHHRLLDIIAAASGLGPTAGTVATIVHRDDPKIPHLFQLGSTDEEHNPDLLPGDTIQVSRAGLVYVLGDVIRPGGFTVDPQQQLTVLQAVSLAWGPSQNAVAQKAVLIREQSGGGRTVIAINLKRMLHGQDPDLLIHERDILYVPDSMLKNVWNRSLESVVQSAAGVGIYAGLVYSQRF